MTTYKFSGRVLPPSANFTMLEPIQAGWKDSVTSLDMTGTVRITRGVVEVVCDSNLPFNHENTSTALFHVLNLATAVVSVYAFGKGIGLSVVIESVVMPDGIKHNIESKRAELEALATALHSRQDGALNVEPVLPFVLNDPTIFVALTDLVGAVDRSVDAPMKCGRAVDAIRHCMAPQNNRSAGWPAMRDMLNLTQPFLEFITEISKGPRHWNVMNIPVAKSDEIIRRSCIVMNRFLEFKKRGDQQLPLDEFRLL